MSRPYSILTLAGCCLAALLHAASPALAAPLPAELIVADWPSRIAHPLAGKILRTRDGAIVDAVALARGILSGSPITRALGVEGATFVLLGEVHDNPEHHLLRAGLIDALTEPNAFGRNSHPAVVTEHIRADQAPALATFRNRAAGTGEAATARDLLALLEWDKSGWPPSPMFLPLYDAVVGAHLEIVPGDAPRARIRAIARTGESELTADERSELRLDVAFAQPLADALATELRGSHCGMLPDAAIPAMALAQRYRDAHLASAMATAAGRAGTAILLAGNGHVRTDRGVPWYLRQAAPGKRIVAIMLVEVAAGNVDPQAYVPRAPDGTPAIDVVFFTPPAVREDPCERMRSGGQKRG